MYKIEDFEKKKKRLITGLKIFNICIYLIIIPIIIYNLVLIVNHITNPSKSPDFFGFKTYEIVSKSMENTINKNDIIVVKNVNEDEIKVNDIIAFRNKDEIITHRITKIENINGKNFYTTKGDNNKFIDKDKIIYNQIEGKYIIKINKLGYFTNFLKNRYILIILFILLIFCLIHIFKVRQRKNNREKAIKEKAINGGKNESND